MKIKDNKKEEELLSTYAALVERRSAFILSSLDITDSDREILFQLSSFSLVDIKYIIRTFLWDCREKREGKSRTSFMWRIVYKRPIPQEVMTKEEIQEAKRKYYEEHPEHTYTTTVKYKHAGIYCIAVGGRVLYIGKSKNMYQRLLQHFKAIKYETYPEKKYRILQDAIKKGLTIQFDVVEYTTEEELAEREAYYINYYFPPLNTQIPIHDGFERYPTKINMVETITDAFCLAKDR